MTERARHHAPGSAMMRIYREWDDALGAKDAATAATLYHPDGDQMDIVEVMEIQDGLIAAHRVYWGWLGVGMLLRDEHGR
jgi:ketosteroid isomerase-like protein